MLLLTDFEWSLKIHSRINRRFHASSCEYLMLNSFSVHRDSQLGGGLNSDISPPISCFSHSLLIHFLPITTSCFCSCCFSCSETKYIRYLTHCQFAFCIYRTRPCFVAIRLVMTRYQGFNFDTISAKYRDIDTISIFLNK